jgi:D-aminopeptidase
VSLPDALTLRVELQYPEHAEVAVLVPGVRQIDAVTLEADVATPDELVALVTLWYETTPTRPW